MTDRPVDRANRAYDSIRVAIIEAALPSDTKLGEETLAEHFGVSRTLIRSVLARLVSEGLAETGRGRSVRVAHPTKDEARDAFTVRFALERSALEILANCWTASIEDRLRTHIDNERTALASGNSMASSRLGNEFHITVAAATGNALLHKYASEVVSRAALIIAIYGHGIDQAASIKEHDQLVELLKAGDAQGAITLASHHLNAVETDTLSAPDQVSGSDLTAILSRY